MATIFRVTKHELRTRLLKYARVYSMTEHDVDNIVERLPLHTLICVAEAFHYHYLLCRLCEKYSSVRKLVFKLVENE